jgi:hypothetical protein
MGGVVDLTCGNNCTAGTGGHAIVDVSQTWPAIPIPYLVDGTGGAGLQIEGAGSAHARLTIAWPNTLELKSGGDLEVDPNQTAQADLVAKNVTFTSASPAPSPGAWYGIELVMTNAGLANSSLVGCTIAYAGDYFQLPAGASACTSAYGAVYVNNAFNTVAPGPTISGAKIQDYPATNYGIVTANVSVTSTAIYALRLRARRPLLTLCWSYPPRSPRRRRVATGRTRTRRA